MKVEMKMPDLGTTEAEVKVLNWLVEVGQPVRRGQPLLEVETDKTTMEVEAIATGVLTEICVDADDEVPAGQLIAVIESEQKVAASPPPPPEVPSQAPAESSPQAPPAARTGGMFARNRQAAPTAVERTQSIPLSSIQRTVAQRMTESKQTIPHFYVQMSVNAEPMAARRSAAAKAGKKLLWDAFFIFAAGKALKQYDKMCYRFENDCLVPRGTADVGLAIDLDGKLFVIPVAEPATKTPEQISEQITTAVEQLRSGDATAMKIRPASITITNLGGANVESFIPIINPPESAILGVGKIAAVPVVVDDAVAVARRASLTLAVDHRVVNGKYASEFLGEIVRQLESL